MKLGLDKAVLQSMGGDKAANPVSSSLIFFSDNCHFYSEYFKCSLTSSAGDSDPRASKLFDNLKIFKECLIFFL